VILSNPVISSKMNPPVVGGAQHPEVKHDPGSTISPPLGKPTQFHHHQPADRVGSLVAEFGLEVLVEVSTGVSALTMKGIALRSG
jgi:hypothetical protein